MDKDLFIHESQNFSKSLRNMSLLIKVASIHFLFLAISSAAVAEQIAGCHCFNNRSFDPARPDSVDPYLLATTQNSFLAAVFNIHKKQIVRAKMKSGASGDDLWVAHFVSAKTGADVKQIIASRSASGSWEKALGKNKFEDKRLGILFTKALAEDSSDNQLAAIVVDQMVIDSFGVKKTEVKKLRDAGAQNKEMILSIFLSKRSQRTATDYYATVRNGQSTWGKHLNNLRIEAQNMGTEINKMLVK